MNRAILVGKRFTGGTGFNGEILIRFAQGSYIWRLEWKNPEPGVVQYQWTRSRQPFDSEAAAYRAAQWQELTEAELRQYGGWVEKAVEGMVSRRETLAMLSGVVGVAIDLMGGIAVTVLWSAMVGQSDSGGQQPPAQGNGQLISFPTRPPPSSTVQLPAAASAPFH